MYLQPIDEVIDESGRNRFLQNENKFHHGRFVFRLTRDKISTNRGIYLFLDNYTTSISFQSIYTDIDYNFEVIQEMCFFLFIVTRY